MKGHNETFRPKQVKMDPMFDYPVWCKASVFSQSPGWIWKNNSAWRRWGNIWEHQHLGNLGQLPTERWTGNQILRWEGKIAFVLGHKWADASNLKYSWSNRGWMFTELLLSGHNGGHEVSDHCIVKDAELSYGCTMVVCCSTPVRSPYRILKP